MKNIIVNHCIKVSGMKDGEYDRDDMIEDWRGCLEYIGLYYIHSFLKKLVGTKQN